MWALCFLTTACLWLVKLMSPMVWVRTCYTTLNERQECCSATRKLTAGLRPISGEDANIQGSRYELANEGGRLATLLNYRDTPELGRAILVRDVYTTLGACPYDDVIGVGDR